MTKRYTLYAKAAGDAMVFDKEPGGHSFAFHPHRDEKGQTQWSMQHSSGAFRPDMKQADLRDNQFNLQYLRQHGYRRVESFGSPDNPVALREWLASIIPQAYRSAVVGRLAPCAVDERHLLDSLARFYRREQGLADPIWREGDPLPAHVRLSEGAPHRSAYDF